MTAEDLVTIAKYADPHEASMARAMLESHGIHGLTVGGEINNTLWHLGPTISGVELQVASAEAVQASEILDELHKTKRLANRVDWFCPRCGEEVDAAFDVCWSCGTSIEEASADPAEPPSTPLQTAELPAENPEPEIPEERESPEPLSSAKAWARRALKAAVIGIIFAPVLFYVLYFLLRLWVLIILTHHWPT